MEKGDKEATSTRLCPEHKWPIDIAAPQPMALVPWIWNLGLSGAEIWIYHRLEDSDPRLATAAATLKSFEPYPCGSTVRLQQLLPNKGREAAVYLSHVVRHYDTLPQGLVLVHDHGPAARHSLCGPFFRRLRGYYAGIREQAAAGWGNGTAALAVAGGGARRRLEATRRKGSGSSSSSSSAARKALLAEFADQAISLSSGCQVRARRRGRGGGGAYVTHGGCGTRAGRGW